MLSRDRAICLRTVDFSETSQVVTLFARRMGKYGAMAKGSRRAKSAFDGPIEIFSCGEVQFSPNLSGSLATLTEFQQQPRFVLLRRNLHAMDCALFAAELVDSMTQQYDPHPDLYDRFITFLEDVQHSPDSNESMAFLIVFQLTLLREVGGIPVLNQCANCSRSYKPNWQEVFFSSRANGLVCADCESVFTERIRLAPAVASCFADLKRIPRADEAILRKMEKILIGHFTEILHRRPKLASHFL
ncbi:MAG: DNA repair protein RecO [Sedimentisphaerales bacterium]|nr:DNA repair protein RecO [Sedimentisphaerales bacterium]